MKRKEQETTRIKCTLKVNRHSTASLNLDLKGNFSRAAVDTELKKHPWFYKNRDRLKYEME